MQSRLNVHVWQTAVDSRTAISQTRVTLERLETAPEEPQRPHDDSLERAVSSREAVVQEHYEQPAEGSANHSR